MSPGGPGRWRKVQALSRPPEDEQGAAGGVGIAVPYPGHHSFNPIKSSITWKLGCRIQLSKLTDSAPIQTNQSKALQGCENLRAHRGHLMTLVFSNQSSDSGCPLRAKSGHLRHRVDMSGKIASKPSPRSPPNAFREMTCEVRPALVEGGGRLMSDNKDGRVRKIPAALQEFG